MKKREEKRKEKDFRVIQAVAGYIYQFLT